MSETTAFLMSTMLADVINAGTALHGARRSGSRCRPPARPARPTTTATPGSSASRRSWSTGVWVGFDQRQDHRAGSGYAGEIAVPLWAGFMKAATKARQAGMVGGAARHRIGMNVCRMSGKRPAGGCDHVAGGQSTTASVEKQSMIDTEYFVRGTEPDRDVPPARRPVAVREDGGRGLRQNWGPIARCPPTERFAGAADSPTPQAPLVRPPARCRRTGASQKKRGFWSRVFGRGDKKDEDKKDEPKRPG